MDNQLESDTVFFMKTLKNLEDKQLEIKKELEVMQTAEIQRILREFNANQYERRYRVGKDIVLSVFIGEDNINNVMAIEKREKAVSILIKVVITRKNEKN